MMNVFLKNLLSLFLSFALLESPSIVNATPNFDLLRGFETLNQIPDHANPCAGMSLLHMLPMYLNTLNEHQTPGTKKLLNKLFVCPSPDLNASHIMAHTGEFQIAHHLTPVLVGEIIATLDFYEINFEKKDLSLNKKNVLKQILIEKLKSQVPQQEEFFKKTRFFINQLMKSLEECGYFENNRSDASLIPYFTHMALIAFVCITASSKEPLKNYCAAYQQEKNILNQTKLEIQIPSDENKNKKSNPFLVWKPQKALSQQNIFIGSLIAFLKSTHNEIAQIIEIPDIRTRGTRYPVCIETLLCNLSKFALKSTTLKNKPKRLTDFFAHASTEDLEEHIIDFSQMINNLPAVVYGKIITSDNSIIDRHKNLFGFTSKVDGFVHLNCTVNEENIRNFFMQRKDFKIIKELDGIIFISLGNKTLGVYDATQAYGLALRANLNNITTALTHLFEVDFEIDNAALLCDAQVSYEAFAKLTPHLGWESSYFSCAENFDKMSISVTNNTGSLIINLEACHGFCSYAAQKKRLRGRSNTYARSLLKAYCADNSTKLLTLLTAIAPWELSELANMPLMPHEMIAVFEKINQRIPELPTGLARHIYLGQEITNQNCVISINDILSHDNGKKLIDVINFLQKNIKSNLSDNLKNVLKTSITQSPWIDQHPVTKEKLEILLS